MWKRLLNSGFYISFLDSDLLEIFVTDFISLWTNNIRKNDFTTIMKESNLRLEINETELTCKGLQMLQKPEDLKDSHALEDVRENLELNLMKSFGFPVRLKITLCKGTKELFFQKVTYPLLQSTKDLKHSQEELCKLLLRKDQEIQEYKEEGGRIALRHLKTPKFDESKHLSAHKSYSRNFGFEEIPDSLMDKINSVTVAIKQEPVEIPQATINRNIEIKTEKTELKQEPASVKRENNSQHSHSILTSPRKRPKKLLNL